jgi:hypothetical protein
VAELEYVPTLVERIAEAIPTELTATAAVGIGGARRLKIARAVLPVVQAELELIVAATRRQVAEETRALYEIATNLASSEAGESLDRDDIDTLRRYATEYGIDPIEVTPYTWTRHYPHAFKESRSMFASERIWCDWCRWEIYNPIHTDNAAIARGRGETGGGQ